LGLSAAVENIVGYKRYGYDKNKRAETYGYKLEQIRQKRAETSRFFGAAFYPGYIFSAKIQAVIITHSGTSQIPEIFSR
jgi:hypothetical protein